MTLLPLLARAGSLTLALLLSACDVGPSAAEHMTRAKELAASQDLRAAVIELKNALQKEPEHGEARWLLGKTYLELGDGAGAEKELARARRLGISDPELPVALARALLLERRYQEALDELAKVPAEPPSATALTLRGEAHLGLAQRDEARSAFERALQADPGATDARTGLASLALLQGQVEDAEAHLDQALERDPAAFRALMIKGEILLSRRQAEPAEAVFSRALAAAGGESAPARLALARAKLARGDTDGATEQVRAVRARSPNDPLASYLLGAIAYQRKDLTQAQDALRDVLRVAPDHLPTLLLLGTIQYSQGQLEQAEEHLSRYTAAVPGNVASRKLLAAVRLARREPERALEALTPAAEQAAGDPQFLALLGTAYLRRGDAARAAEYLEKASQLAPDMAAIRTQLALSHLATGQTREAITELESAVEIDPGLVQADVLLVLTHLRQGKTDEALEAARKLVERQPESPLAHNLLGAARLAKQDPGAARAAFEEALRVSPGFVPAALNLAQLDLRENQPDAARTRFESVLKLQEHNPQALLGLARLEGQRGETGRAVELLERARQHNPGALEPRVLLASYYLETGKPDRAGELTTEALGIAPNNPAVLVLHGQVQLQTGRAADASRTFGALVERGVQTVDLYLRLAAAQAARGQIEPARASYRKALELSGDKHPGALLGLGRLEVAAGRPEAAREAAARLRAIVPDSPLGPTLEGDALLAVGKLAEATAAYQEALARGESSEVVLKLAQARRAAGDIAGGRQGLRDWVTRHPDDRAVRLALASALQLDGAVAEAVQEYEGLIEQQPTNAIALNNLAWLYYEARDPRALDLAERAVKEAPENPAILDTAGWIQVQQGKMEQGLQLLRQASDRAPQAGEIRYHLGAALARTGDMAGARRELQAALATAGEQPWRAEAKRLLDLLP